MPSNQGFHCLAHYHLLEHNTGTHHWAALAPLSLSLIPARLTALLEWSYQRVGMGNASARPATSSSTHPLTTDSGGGRGHCPTGEERATGTAHTPPLARPSCAHAHHAAAGSVATFGARQCLGRIQPSAPSEPRDLHATSTGSLASRYRARRHGHSGHGDSSAPLAPISIVA